MATRCRSFLVAPGVVGSFTWAASGESIGASYRGTPEALTAAGALTAEMLAPNPRGRTRRDADGDLVWISRRGGRSWIDLNVWKPLERARALPGVEHWLAEIAPPRPRPEPLRDVPWSNEVRPIEASVH
jgi:hypothetical protein